MIWHLDIFAHWKAYLAYKFSSVLLIFSSYKLIDESFVSYRIVVPNLGKSYLQVLIEKLVLCE